MNPVRQTSTGVVHLVNSLDGYELPDWEILPSLPTVEPNRWQWSGTGWEENTDYAFQILRTQRDSLLDQTDKYMISDRPMAAELRDLWIAYRQALRDLPENVTDPFDFQWPPAPE